MEKGSARKLTIYVDENDMIGSRPVYEVVMDLFYKRRIAGVSVFRGVAGYGSDGVFHKAKVLDLSASLPIKIEAIDSEEMIEKVVEEVSEIVSRGLIEVSETTVLKCH